MLAEKMQFPMPMAAAYEGFPFTTTNAEKAEEEEEAAFLKAKAQEEASFTVKAGCGSRVEEVDKVLDDATTEADSDSDDEDGEDPEVFMARMNAEYKAHHDKMMADNPWLHYGDYDPEEYTLNGYFPRQQQHHEEEAAAVVDSV